MDATLDHQHRRPNRKRKHNREPEAEPEAEPALSPRRVLEARAAARAKHGPVRQWLEQIPDSCMNPRLRDGESSDELDLRDTRATWRPNNLPVAAIDPTPRPRPWRRSWGECAPMDWDPSIKASSASISIESTYERRPRRKTRHDRYETKKHETKPKSPTRDKKSQSRKSKQKKPSLRSGRDIMDNFVSETLPNGPLIMKPNLTAGLFTNGRSSKTNQLTDLVFNNLVILSYPEEGGHDTRRDRTCQKRVTNRSSKDVDQDAEFFDSLRRHDKIKSRSQPAPQPSLLPTEGSTRKEAREEKSLEVRGASRATTDINLSSSENENINNQSLGNQSSGSDAAEAERLKELEKALVQTGIFDHTGIQGRDTATGCSAPFHKSVQSTTGDNRPLYEDKAIMVSPMSQAQPLPPEPPNISAESRPSPCQLPLCHEDGGFLQFGIWEDRPNVQPLTYGTAIPSYHDEVLPYLPFSGRPIPHETMLAESRIQSMQTPGFAHWPRFVSSLQVPPTMPQQMQAHDHEEIDESFQEYIERIEHEVSLRWEGIGYPDDEMPLETQENMGSFGDDAGFPFPMDDAHRGGLAFQQQGTEKSATEEAEQLQMASFWRPNRFM